jgi:hypothetical protein
VKTSLATMPPIKSACNTAYAVSLTLSAAPCSVLHCHASIKHDAPNAVYYLQLIDSPTPVNGGGAITLIAVKEVNHKQGDTTVVEFDLPLFGVRCATGCVMQLSTTVGTGTLDGLNMLAYGTYI